MTELNLGRVITVANGKGGVGKTSCATNIAGLSAAAGWKTLVVDLDPQGNVGYDLGYRWNGGGDNGDHLTTALTSAQPIHPVLEEVRPNLDVVSGGSRLDDLEDVLTGRARRNTHASDALAVALTETAGDYDLILIDTPPTRPALIQLALETSRWVVVPTKSDRASIEGLRNLAAQIRQAKQTNADLAILGALLFGSGSSATTIRANAVQDMTDVLGAASSVFTNTIRHAEGAAVHAREQGLLAHEIAEQANDAEPFWVALREGRRPQRVPGSAASLAEDYVLLTQELLTRISDHETQEVPA